MSHRFTTYRPHFAYTRLKPNPWDLLAILVFFALFSVLAVAASHMIRPYALGETLPITLDPRALPGYAGQTVLRMGIALVISTLFSFIVGTAAAHSKRAEKLIIPCIDILQSVPILGFLSITVVGFIHLFPNSLLGPECAAIFAIFTAQAWNMVFSLYQSLRTVPTHLQEVGQIFQLSFWQRFWRIDIPFAMPAFLWNMMMSMSGSWFFVVAAEAISVSNQQITLPGVGSYIALAIQNASMPAVCYAIVTMFVVILLYDQLFFRPLLQWAEKFKMEEKPTGVYNVSSWFLTLLQDTRFCKAIGSYIGLLLDQCIIFRLKPAQSPPTKPAKTKTKKMRSLSRIFDWLWDLLLIFIVALSAWLTLQFILSELTWAEIQHVFLLGSFTALRVAVAVILASLIWVPIGICIGIRPRWTHRVQPIAQFLAAFPANLLFPMFVLLIASFHLNIETWTILLMMLGTQWYILFNVIAGASRIPDNLSCVGELFNVKGWLWWRKLALPGVFPFYVTGALTASGGAWNASIVTEVVHWGTTTYEAHGLGAYIVQYTAAGDFPRIALGIGVMTCYVLVFNHLIWRPLYAHAVARYQLL